MSLTNENLTSSERVTDAPGGESLLVHEQGPGDELIRCDAGHPLEVTIQRHVDIWYSQSPGPALYPAIVDDEGDQYTVFCPDECCQAKISKEAFREIMELAKKTRMRG